MRLQSRFQKENMFYLNINEIMCAVQTKQHHTNENSAKTLNKFGTENKNKFDTNICPTPNTLTKQDATKLDSSIIGATLADQ